MPGLRESAELRGKAKEALLMSDTLLTRGSLQRRELLPPTHPSMQFALLSPRARNADPERKRGRARGGGAGRGEDAPPSGSVYPALAYHHAALQKTHEQMLEEAPLLVPSENVYKRGMNKDRRGVVFNPFSQEAPAPSPPLVVKNHRRTEADANRRVTMSGMNAAVQTQLETTWQVARAQEAPEGPPIEVEAWQLGGLKQNALIWTDGLEDWLPIGDLPLPSMLPPSPVSRQALADQASGGSGGGSAGSSSPVP
jgi:hypothetical protein